MKKTEKVILLNKNRWGEKYEIKEFARGFVRYLLLQKQIILANERNLLWLERQKVKQTQADLILKAKNQEIYDKINNLALPFVLKKNEKGEPFGSVGFKEIQTELEKFDFYCQKNQLVGFHPLNKLGENIIKVKLSNSLTANLKIVIEYKN